LSGASHADKSAGPNLSTSIDLTALTKRHCSVPLTPPYVRVFPTKVRDKLSEPAFVVSLPSLLLLPTASLRLTNRLMRVMKINSRVKSLIHWHKFQQAYRGLTPHWIKSTHSFAYLKINLHFSNLFRAFGMVHCCSCRAHTMYIQNRRDSSIFNGCSPLQLCNGLISLKPKIAYFAYTHRCAQVKNQKFNYK
jgi:hypothetical protein